MGMDPRECLTLVVSEAGTVAVPGPREDGDKVEIPDYDSVIAAVYNSLAPPLKASIDVWYVQELMEAQKSSEDLVVTDPESNRETQRISPAYARRLLKATGTTPRVWRHASGQRPLQVTPARSGLPSVDAVVRWAHEAWGMFVNLRQLFFGDHPLALQYVLSEEYERVERIYHERRRRPHGEDTGGRSPAATSNGGGRSEFRSAPFRLQVDVDTGGAKDNGGKPVVRSRAVEMPGGLDDGADHDENAAMAQTAAHRDRRRKEVPANADQTMEAWRARLEQRYAHPSTETSEAGQDNHDGDRGRRREATPMPAPSDLEARMTELQTQRMQQLSSRHT